MKPSQYVLSVVIAALVLIGVFELGWSLGTAKQSNRIVKSMSTLPTVWYAAYWELAAYNRAKSEGAVFSPAYVARMTLYQAAFDAALDNGEGSGEVVVVFQ